MIAARLRAALGQGCSGSLDRTALILGVAAHLRNLVLRGAL